MNPQVIYQEKKKINLMFGWISDSHYKIVSSRGRSLCNDSEKSFLNLTLEQDIVKPRILH